MVNVYEVIRNERNLPELFVTKELPYDVKGGRYHAAQILKTEFYMDKLHNEHIYLVGFNEDWLMSIFLISVGTTTSSAIYRKQIATNLLLAGADSFCLFHNHPNQSLVPSEDDKTTVKELQEIADLLELNFLGSYIITKKGYVDSETSELTTWEGTICKAD